MSDLGQRLEHYRNSDERSWGYIARKIGVSRTILWRIVKGEGYVSQKNIADVEAFLASVAKPVATVASENVTEPVTQKKPRKGRPKSKMPVAVAQLILDTVAGHPDWKQPQVAQYVTAQTGYKVYQRLVSLVVNNPESYLRVS